MQKGVARIAIGPKFRRYGKLSLVSPLDPLGLTPRERQLYNLLTEDRPRSIKEIAVLMGNTPGSMKIRIGRLADKLAVDGQKGIMGFEIRRLRNEIRSLRMEAVDLEHPGAD